MTLFKKSRNALPDVSAPPRFPRGATSLCSAALLALLVVGCSTIPSPEGAISPEIKGTVMAGGHPVSNALIQLYALGINGSQSAASPLLDNQLRSNTNGQFDIPGTYSCTSSSSLLYVLATGGNPSLEGNVTNPQLAEMLILGSCSPTASYTNSTVSEMTTIAAVNVLTPFMASPAQVGFSPTDQATVLQAFGVAGELVSPLTGQAPGNDIPTGQLVPVLKIASLANVVDSCIQTTGGSAGDASPCGIFLSLAPGIDGSLPTDTAQALLNIAKNPTSNVSTLFNSRAQPVAFSPELPWVPNDWKIRLTTAPPTPQFSMPAGQYTTPLTIELQDSDPSAVIVFTEDGSTPSFSSPIYSGPIQLTASASIQAEAVIDGISSPLAQANYVVSPPPPPVTISLTPGSVSLSSNQTQQFTAVISGSTNTAVTWSVTPSIGTISPSGLYTAPSTITSSETLTVIATSVADVTKSATSGIILTPPTPPITISLTPGSVSLLPNQTQQFTAVVSGSTNTAVTWSLAPVVGTISSSGLYTAPTAIPSSQTVIVTATSVADLNKSVSSTINLTPPSSPIAISVTPTNVALSAGESQQFQAVVTGSSSTGVTWSINPLVGSISTTGLYTAPMPLTAAQTVTIIATSVADSSRQSSALVTLSTSPVSGVAIAVSPAATSLTQYQVQRFVATVTGTKNDAVSWSLSPAVGSISSTGLYSAPAGISANQTVTLIATSSADPTKSANAMITLLPELGATYYIANNGKDSNSGTSQASPWQTIARVNQMSLQPGDSVLFHAGDTWREQLSTYSRGTKLAPITFASYGTGAPPIISGSDLLTAWTPEAQNLFFTNQPAAPAQIISNGSRLIPVSSKSLVKAGTWWWDGDNKRVYLYGNPSALTIEADQRDYAIYFPCLSNNYATVAALQLEGAKTHGIYTCGSGIWTVSQVSSTNNVKAGLRMDTPSSGTSITYTTVANNGDSGIDLYQSPEILVSHVTAYNNVALPGNLFAAGIKLAPSRLTTNAIVEFSNSYSNGLNQPGITGSGIWADTVGDGLQVLHNTVYGNQLRGLDIDADNNVLAFGNIVYNNLDTGILAYADNEQSITGISIINNTVWGNNTGVGIQGPSSGTALNGCTSNTIENNIVGASVTRLELSAQFGCNNPGAGGSGNRFIYNSFGPATNGFIRWGASGLMSSYSQWELAPGSCGSAGCSSSLETDPKLSNPAAADFSLQSGSPAIGAGFGGVNLGVIP